MSVVYFGWCVWCVKGNKWTTASEACCCSPFIYSVYYSTYTFYFTPYYILEDTVYSVHTVYTQHLPPKSCSSNLWSLHGLWFVICGLWSVVCCNCYLYPTLLKIQCSKVIMVHSRARRLSTASRSHMPYATATDIPSTHICFILPEESNQKHDHG